MKTLQAKILDATHLELIEPIPVRPGRQVEVSIRFDEDEDPQDISGSPRAAQLKFEVVSSAARHSFPTADIDQMLAEIEQGYGAPATG